MIKLLSLLTVFTFQEATAQIKSCDTIFWNANRKLNWTDFDAEPDSTSSNSARTAAAISYNLVLSENAVTIKFACKFYSCRSWTKCKEGCENLLQHEQTHFDIFEYHKRLFIQSLLNANLTYKNALAEIEKEFKNINGSNNQMSNQYDSETKFSTDLKQQTQWTNKVNDLLKEIENYNRETITITFRK
jgi:hypothetical protein